MACENSNPFYNIQCQQLNNAPLEFLGILIVNTLIIVVTLFLFKVLWVQKIGITFPIFSDDHEEQSVLFLHIMLVSFGNSKLSIGFEFVGISDINILSIEGFQYLYVQRSFFVLMLIFLAISLISLFTVPQVTILTLFVLDGTFTYGYQFMMTSVYTMVLMWFLNKLMFAVTSVEGNSNTNWLRKHTLHIRGIPVDLPVNKLQYNLQYYLQKLGIKGDVLWATILPNYGSLLELESTKAEWDIYAQYLGLEKPPIFMSCLPSKYKCPSYYYDKQIEIAERQSFILKGLLQGSGHAFVFLDNDDAVKHLIEKYFFFKKMSRYSTTKANVNCCRALLNQILDPICGANQEVPRAPEGPPPMLDETPIPIDISHYLNNSVQAISEDLEVEDSNVQHIRLPKHHFSLTVMNKSDGQQQPFIVIKEAPMPKDILFTNLTTSLKGDLCRRVTFNLCAFLLLFFGTTPASVFSFVGLVQAVGSIRNSVFIQYIMIALVDGVNCLILLLIEYSVEFQRPTCRWIYQRSIYSRCVFYLTMNMLIIPAISFVAVTNLYQLFFNEFNNLFDLIKGIYFFVNGRFFACLIVSSAGSSFGINMLRVADTIWAWGSTRLADYQRSQIKRKSPHLCRPGTEFRYGYFYGLQIAVLYIIMMFCTNVPIIQFGGAIYYVVRLYQDSFTLHWYFREDLNSDSQLAQNVIISAGFSIIPLQLVELSIFFLAQEILYLIGTLILLATTIIFNFSLRQSRDRIRYSKHYHPQEKNVPQFVYQSWKQQFKHPLLLTSEKKIVMQN